MFYLHFNDVLTLNPRGSYYSDDWKAYIWTNRAVINGAARILRRTPAIWNRYYLLNEGV